MKKIISFVVLISSSMLLLIIIFLNNQSIEVKDLDSSCKEYYYNPYSCIKIIK